MPQRGHLRAYHGIQNQYLRASVCLDAIVAFLDLHPREAIVVSIKAEDATHDFEERVKALLDRRPDRWYREAQWPTLGEARGRAVLFARYGRDPNSALLAPGRADGAALRPPIWPNNLRGSFEYELAGVRVVTQDWYDIGSMLVVPEKAELVGRLLRDSAPVERPTIRLNFASAGSLLAMPSSVRTLTSRAEPAAGSRAVSVCPDSSACEGSTPGCCRFCSRSSVPRAPGLCSTSTSRQNPRSCP